MEIHAKNIFINLLYIIFILLFANVVGIVTKLYFGHGRIYGLFQLFDFNSEKNIPTLYSSFILITASILLSFIASTHKRLGSSYFYWLGLAIVFLFLSIDETVMIHEHLTVPVRQLLNTSGLFRYAWVIPYGIGLVMFVIIYLKFLISLPKTIMILFVVSGTTFVLGAMGFEMLGGWYHGLYGRENLAYSFIYTCEEFFEMLGVAMFIYTLLLYITSQFKFLTISAYEEK